MSKFFFAFVFCFVLSTAVQAEYRAYRLGIKYHPEDPDEEETEVITNLDNFQYDSYFKVTPDQRTRIIHHWMCWGRTDGQDYCAEPPVQSPNIRLPASVLK